MVTITDRPGLGVEIDRDAIMAAHALYREHGLGARDDAAAMQYLMPGPGRSGTAILPPWIFSTTRMGLSSTKSPVSVRPLSVITLTAW